MIHQKPTGPIVQKARNGTYTVLCFPPEPTFSWSLKDFYSKEEADCNPVLRDRLREILKELGVTTAYAPSISFASGEVTWPHRLRREVPLGEGYRLNRDKGVFADGVVLPQKTAFVGSIAGPVVVMSDGKMCVVASAARDSLIDRRKILGTPPYRRFESVIYAMNGMFGEDQTDTKNLNLEGFFSLQTLTFPHPFDDEQHGRYNKRLVQHGRDFGSHVILKQDDCVYLSLSGLIMAQARQLQIPHSVCRFPISDDGILAHPRHKDPALQKARNLVIVHHH